MLKAAGYLLASRGGFDNECCAGASSLQHLLSKQSMCCANLLSDQLFCECWGGIFKELLFTAKLTERRSATFRLPHQDESLEDAVNRVRYSFVHGCQHRNYTQATAFLMGTHRRSVLSPVCKCVCVIGLICNDMFDVLQLVLHLLLSMLAPSVLLARCLACNLANQ